MNKEVVTKFTDEESKMIHQINMGGYGLAQGTDKIIDKTQYPETPDLKLVMKQILQWWELLDKNRETFMKLKEEVDKEK